MKKIKKEVQDFMRITGASPTSFCRNCGVSLGTLQHIFNGVTVSEKMIAKIRAYMDETAKRLAEARKTN